MVVEGENYRKPFMTVLSLHQHFSYNNTIIKGLGTNLIYCICVFFGYVVTSEIYSINMYTFVL